MNFLIVDDDPITCKQIAGYIELLGENDQITIASDGPEALRELTNHSFDVVFLDLNLPQLDGKSILETITDKLSVIIISASTDFAAESYNYNVADYLVKPIAFPRFSKAIAKVKESWIQKNRAAEAPSAIFLRDKGTIERINLTDLDYIEASGNYASFHFSNKKSLMRLMSLQKLSIFLPSNFLRVHRSFIVNLEAIQRIEGSSIIMGSHKIPVGKSYRAVLNERIQISN